MPNPVTHLDPDQLDAFGDELDDLRRRTVADLGTRDRDYLERVVRAQRGLEFAGRALMMAGFLPPAWVGGTTALALSKILDNMEIGHNVMHGQYDFLQDPAFDGNRFEWDTACPGDSWRRTHNYEHHTFTNILGKDRDIGYSLLRVTEDQPWKPADLGNPVYATLLAVFFQYGVMLHELEADRLMAGEKSWAETAELRGEMAEKVVGQTLKDYVLFPLLSGPSAPLTVAGNAVANLARNLWSFSIIFCGHFPDGTITFTEEEAAEESRGQWYLRQLLGSANISGGPLFHVMSGNLSHQIEHHLFPDIPAHRYPEMATEVREICQRYELPYNTGGFAQQFGSVVRKIATLALPWTGSGDDGGDPGQPQLAVVASPGATARQPAAA
ncbi:acyl-CoA desaturase [soil metagenome]